MQSLNCRHIRCRPIAPSPLRPVTRCSSRRTSYTIEMDRRCIPATPTAAQTSNIAHATQPVLVLVLLELHTKSTNIPQRGPAKWVHLRDTCALEVHQKVGGQLNRVFTIGSLGLLSASTKWCPARRHSHCQALMIGRHNLT